jgi:hypothetical protein
MLTIRPAPFAGALRNPLMGFRKDLQSPKELAAFEWVTLARQYIKWNEIEARESDGTDKIRAFCDDKWHGLDAVNVKVIPRVYLHWSKDDPSEKYWPEDLATDDYSSPRFVKRLLRLIERLGQAWDGDARVAFVQMGLIGKWGEQHSPSITPELQELMGDAFSRAFTRTKVMVRHPWDFSGFNFGIYWDSWAHIEQMESHGEGIAKLGPRWKSAPIGGEVAYDWGRFREQPGENPSATLAQEIHRKYLVDSIRHLHCNHLGWISDYDAAIPDARAGAAIVQRAFGYRFEIASASFPARLEPNQEFPFEIQILNTGSTPLYADWPLRLHLLDAKTRREVWHSDIAARDARTNTWLPGDSWDAVAQSYKTAPVASIVRTRLRLGAVPRGEYLLAVSVIDPAGNSPALHMATSQYWSGGLHLLARVSVAAPARDAALRGIAFDTPGSDRSLRYFAAA